MFVTLEGRGVSITSQSLSHASSSVGAVILILFSDEILNSYNIMPSLIVGISEPLIFVASTFDCEDVVVTCEYLGIPCFVYDVIGFILLDYDGFGMYLVSIFTHIGDIFKAFPLDCCFHSVALLMLP